MNLLALAAIVAITIAVVVCLVASAPRELPPAPGGLELAPPLFADCPTCKAQLEPMDRCALGAVGVCPECGELVRRVTDRVRVYTDREARDAHPEILAKLRRIQEKIRASNLCACPDETEADGCVCGGGCDCHSEED